MPGTSPGMTKTLAASRRVGKAKRAHHHEQARKWWARRFAPLPTLQFLRYPFTAAFGQYLSRKCRFTNFPVGVRGNSASKSMLFGHLIGDKCLRQNTISSA